MEIRKVKTIFGKEKYYLYEDGEKIVNLAFDYAETVPCNYGHLVEIDYKGKCDVVDSSIKSIRTSHIIENIKYDECYDYESFVFLRERNGHNLKILDKKTKKDIVVANGFLYACQSDKFIVYCDWSNEYRAVLNTSAGMDTYTLPDMQTNFCVQHLFEFCGDYLNSAHLIADSENPRRVYKIMRDFLKRLLQEDIVNFDRNTKKYFMPDYDLNNVACKTKKYSTPEKAKEEANKVLKHFDKVVLAAIERVEEMQNGKQVSVLEQEQQEQQREQDIQAALEDFNAEENDKNNTI